MAVLVSVTGACGSGGETSAEVPNQTTSVVGSTPTSADTAVLDGTSASSSTTATSTPTTIAGDSEASVSQYCAESIEPPQGVNTLDWWHHLADIAPEELRSAWSTALDPEATPDQGQAAIGAIGAYDDNVCQNR